MNLKPEALDRVQALAPYVPGLSIAEIQDKFGLDQVIKLASNENPLGASPLAMAAARAACAMIFRYPQGGNPRLVRALAALHDADPGGVVVGNGSDEIIDLLIRILAMPGKDNIVCFEPCFSIYPIQAAINGVETRRVPIEADFSFSFQKLLASADNNTRLVFITTPDNPSGYCPPVEEVASLAEVLAANFPAALLVIDEAYMDFAADEKRHSLLASRVFPQNVAFLRTFSKSWGLAGLRLGYGILPPGIADCFWRARLPFSVNIMVEEAALAALKDTAFREATLAAVKTGREFVAAGLRDLGCQVWPSAANFLLFSLPPGAPAARECFEALLRKGIIIRHLASYNLPCHLRVSIGNFRENMAFLNAMEEFLGNG